MGLRGHCESMGLLIYWENIEIMEASLEGHSGSKSRGLGKMYLRVVSEVCVRGLYLRVVSEGCM